MGEQSEEGDSTSDHDRNPGTGYAAGGILAILSITAATAIYPDYSIRNQAISYLGGAGVKTERYWNIAVVIVGILWTYSTIILHRSHGRAPLTVILSLTGAGFIIVGTSPWNLFPETHFFGVNMVFLFGALGCIYSARVTKGGFSILSIIAGILSISAYVSGYFGGDYILGPGGMERMMYYPVLLWSIAFGAYLINRFQ